MLNGKPAMHFTGEEFGFAIQIPHNSLAADCKEYYGKIRITHFDPKINSSGNALVVCATQPKGFFKNECNAGYCR
jgi:hypothetical protein